MAAAADVIQERGYEAATMAEIAARADTRIGSLYRFFPNKETIGDALTERYIAVLADEYTVLRKRAGSMTPSTLADALIDQLVRLEPQTRAVIALLDSRTEWTEVRLGLRSQALAGIAAALKACAPKMAADASDVAVVVFNNMKTMVGMATARLATSTGAPDELRLMNRLYLEARLS